MALHPHASSSQSFPLSLSHTRLRTLTCCPSHWPIGFYPTLCWIFCGEISSRLILYTPYFQQLRMATSRLYVYNVFDNTLMNLMRLCILRRMTIPKTVSSFQQIGLGFPHTLVVSEHSIHAQAESLVTRAALFNPLRQYWTVFRQTICFTTSISSSGLAPRIPYRSRSFSLPISPIFLPL